MASIAILVPKWYAQIETPDNPNPRLLDQVQAGATFLTFTLTAPLQFPDGSDPDAPFILEFLNASDQKPMAIYVNDPATELSADQKTITLASATQKNINVMPDSSGNIDFFSGTTPDFDLEGDSPVRGSISALDFKMHENVLLGVLGTGARNFIIGDGTVNATQGFEIDQGLLGSTTKYGADASGNPLITLPDGSSFIPGAGAGAISGGDGINFAGSVISVDLTDTTTFVLTSSGAADDGLAVILNASGQFAAGFIGSTADATSTEIAQLSGTTNIAEADTFFGLTNATGTEMETLTDGSDAGALHVHPDEEVRSNGGQTTRAAGTASGDEVIAHGLTKTPKKITFFSGSTAGATSHSNGFVDDDLNNFSTYEPNGAWVTGTNCIDIDNGSGGKQQATVSAWDATNFTLSWVKVGAGRQASVSWVAEA